MPWVLFDCFSLASCELWRVWRAKVANAAVLNSEQSYRDKGKYTHYTGAKIAKYAAECGNLGTIRHFLGESIARLFKKQYCHKVKVKGGIVHWGWTVWVGLLPPKLAFV